MQPGGAVYYFVPWDQLEFLLAAAEPTFGKPIEMIVWADAKGTRWALAALPGDGQSPRIS
jgi:hypothetical protein